MNNSKASNIITLNTRNSNGEPVNIKSNIDCTVSLEGIAATLRKLYIEKASTETVQEYRIFFDSICNAAAIEIKSNIEAGKDPIFIYNPAETTHGITLSKVDLKNFKDPVFYMIMQEYAKKTGFDINTKVIPVKMPLSPITDMNGKHPEAQIKPTAMPVIIISI